MKRYIRIYWYFLKICFSNLLVYRAGFFSHMLGSVIWGVFHYISVLLITYRIQSVYGWSKADLLVLTSTFGIMWGMFRLLFVKNFHQFAPTILYGRLDGLLIKPIDSQFLMSLSQVAYDEFVRIVIGIFALITVINIFNVQVTLVGVILYFVLIIFTLIISYSAWFTILTFIMWNPKLTNLIELLYSASGVMRHPPELFSRFGSLVVFIVTPLLFAISVPTKLLIGKPSLVNIVWLILIAMGAFMTSRIFWRHALKSYTSVNN